MLKSLVRKDTCRLCKSSNLILVININPSPIADDYVKEEDLDKVQDLYPLDLFLCENCGHIQNIYVVNPDLLFRDYTFFTSNFKGLVKHFKLYASDLLESFNFRKGSLAFEIGSNDGTFLVNLKENGMKVIGIDPSIDAADKANKRNIFTIPDYFSSSISKDIVKSHGEASLVIANNVFAHSDNLIDIIEGISLLLSENGIFVFEVSYLLNIVDDFLFDTVYHEHVSYHSIVPLQKVFSNYGLEIFDIKSNKSKGGSIRCFVKKMNSIRYNVKETVNEHIKNEINRGFLKREVYENYNRDILQKKAETLNLIDDLLKDGKKIVGYGASTTVTTLMWHFELTEKLLFLVDDNKNKHYLFSPRSHLEVFPSSEIINQDIDFVIILAWNYSKVIIENNKEFKDKGGKFIIPLPQLEII